MAEPVSLGSTLGVIVLGIIGLMYLFVVAILAFLAKLMIALAPIIANIIIGLTVVVFVPLILLLTFGVYKLTQVRRP